MSGFERALLEGKERDELSKIAESLGKKPPARAKKADMIDLILILAGVTADGAPAADGAGAEASDDDSRAEGAPSAAEAATPMPAPGPIAAKDSGSTKDSGSQINSGAPKKNDQEAPDPKDANGKDSDQQGANQQGADQQNGNQQAGGQRNGGQKAASQQNGGQQNGQNQADGEDGEPGNRRRRRRGRGDRGGQGQNQNDTYEGDPIDVDGLLDLRDDGYGFLRLTGYLPSKDDVYVSVKQVRQFGLRKGDRLAGKSRPASRNEKNPALLQIDRVNGGDPEPGRARPRFEDLTPLFPDERLSLETNDSSNMTARIIDLISPIGKGQRGLIVSPPKAGKTTIMKQIARSIETNAPDCELIVLLVDERPEEVTDMKRWLLDGEVAASTFDRPSDEHVQVAELVLERAKRMVEDGKDVVIILDGITRLARAYNLANPATGRIMSGGIDAGALYPPKRFFGAARNVEEGGSLTILATALVETNSKMDEHIFEEFKGTGNMELKLDRRLAERRIFPAIDVDASSTRHEELLFERKELQQVWKLRRVLGALKHDEGGGSNAPGLDLLQDRMKSFKTNADFLAEIARSAPGN